MNTSFENIKPLPGTDSHGHILIAGPCSAESRLQVLDTAQQLAAGGVKVFRAGVWKPRTRPGGFEGIGVPALSWLAEVKQTTGMLIATEVATRSHVEAAIQAGIDILWIGARTSANPFAVQEVADAIAAAPRRPAVLVKNPICTDIELWIGALQRILSAGVQHIAASHRGFSSYGDSIYRNRPYWSIPIELHRRIPGLQIICDPSHIAGRRDLVETVASQALDMNFAGLIVEAHCAPDTALSDKAQQLTPSELLSMIARLHREPAQMQPEALDALRSHIDAIDDELVDVLRRRMEISAEIGRYKHAAGMSVVQPVRYNSLIERRVAAGTAVGLDPDFMRRLFSTIHEESVRHQLKS